MNELQKPSLLLALEEGPQAAEAVAETVAFARRRGAKVQLLHVLRKRAGTGPAEPARFMEEAVRSFSEAGLEADVQLRSTSGRTAGRDIAAAAREAEVDLVMFASSGVGDVEAILHGSVSHDVLAETDRPVLLLRAGSGAFLPRRILAATEGGDEERLEAAVNLVALPDTQVVVLHVPQVATGMDVPWVEPGDRALETAEKVANALRRSGLNAEAAVRWGPVAFTIAETAAAEGCDLIVLGSRPPSDLVALLVGSVSQQVIQRSERPVLLASKQAKGSGERAAGTVLWSGVDC